MKLEDRIIKTKLILQKKNPFFSVLLMNARHEVTNLIPTMATNGHNLLINEKFASTLSDEEFTSVILHETLHMALCHVSRGKKHTNQLISNIAADIVVNGILKDNGFTLPENCVEDEQLKHLSYHEIYHILMEKKEEFEKKYGKINICLQGEGNENDSPPIMGDKDSELQQKWNEILKQAEVLSKMKNIGNLGSGLDRIIGNINSPKINWRDYLYRFVYKTYHDFRTFDRRFLYQGIYLDDLDGDEVEIDVYIDSSGSVDERELNEFISEFKGAIACLDRVKGNLYFFDTKLYPSDFDKIEPKGFGGTDFRPMVENLRESGSTNKLAICYTDGYADHNIEPPDCPFLWAISKGGIEDSRVKWGEVIRLGEDY